ncbi:MAG: retroviral-like aspartic protease family protein [Alphaproteobacteria bacterium]|nr:retroviral-like aspartic protease family protein [Alphaproteobacteria bacterium]
MFGHVQAIAAFAAGLIFATSAAAQCIDAPDLAAYQTATPADFAAGTTRRDSLGRVVAPVTVNGQGPFRFIVDTGANRSALSDDLAAHLGLVPNGMDNVHSVHGVSVAPIVTVNQIRYGDVSLNAEAVPMLSGGVLAGEQGLLGVDGMSGRRLRMDFERNCIEIVRSDQARRLRGWSTIRGDMRFGHLVVVRGSVNGIRVHLLLDTGSDSSLANLALRDAMNARLRHRNHREETIAYTAGPSVVLENAISIPRMAMGELEVRNVTAYVGDFHIFQIWNLTSEPTLLLGMDVLSQARGLAIDYGRGTVHLRIRDRLRLETRLQN